MQGDGEKNHGVHVPVKGAHVSEPWDQRPTPLFGNHVTLDKSLNVFELVSLPLKGRTLTLHL